MYRTVLPLHTYMYTEGTHCIHTELVDLLSSAPQYVLGLLPSE